MTIVAADTPLGRVRARAQAREVLGVGTDASSDDIQAAWKRQARSAHPDAASGDSDTFRLAKEAADALLAGIGRPASARVAPRRVMPAPRRIGVADRAAQACETALAAEGPAVTLSLGDALMLPVTPASGIAAGIAPTEVDVQGRRAVFRMAAPLRPGRNRIALPCPVAADRATRRSRAVAVTVIDIVAPGPTTRVPLPEALFPPFLEAFRAVEMVFPDA